MIRRDRPSAAAALLGIAAVLVALLLRDQQAEAAEARIGVLVAPITEIARERELLGWPDELVRTELLALQHDADTTGAVTAAAPRAAHRAWQPRSRGSPPRPPPPSHS